MILPENKGSGGIWGFFKMLRDYRRFSAYGISYMYRKWIEGTYELSADEAADLLFGMMPETLRCYWVD